MRTKDKAVERIENLAYDILDGVVGPTCGLGKNNIWADILLADLGCYDGGKGSYTRKQILIKLSRKYNVPLSVLEFYQDNSLATIALVILMTPSVRKGVKVKHG